MSRAALDAADIRILAALQKHGRLSKTQLADLVGLSSTPCWARLTRLKAAGFVRGFHADIALERIGDVTRVIVTISLTHHRKADLDRFEDYICKLDDVTECIATGGGTDYVLTVVTSGLSGLQDVMDRLLSADLGVDRYMTYIVTRQIKRAQPDLARLVAKPAR